MASPTVSLTYQAEIADLRKKLSSIPDITRAEMNKTVALLHQAVAATNKQVDSTGKAVADMRGKTSLAQESISAFGGALSRISPELGGVVQSAGAMVGGLKSMVGAGSLAGASMGAIAAVAGPLAIGIGVLAAVFVDAQREIALEAETAKIAESAHDSLYASSRALESATIDLRVATGELNEAQGDAARASLAAQNAVIDFGRAQETTKEQIRASIDAAKGWLNILDRTPAAMIGLGDEVKAVAGAVFGWTDAIEAGESQLESLAAAESKAAENTRLARIATEEARAAADRKREADEAGRRAVRASAEAERERTAAARETAAALATLTGIQIQHSDSLLDDEARVIATTQRQIDQINALAAAHASNAAIQAKAAEATQAAIDGSVAQINEIRAAQAAEAQAAADKEIELAHKVAEAAIAADQKVADARAALAQDRIASVVSLASQTEGALSALASNMAENNREAALSVFAIAKAAALAQVAINTAQSVSAVWAAWAAVPPVAIAMSAAAVGVGTVQAGLIASEKLHTGGPVSDEVDRRLLRDEWVSSRQGRSVLGDETLRRADAGMAPQSAVYAVTVYRHTRQVDRYEQDRINAGNPYTKRIDSGRILGHRTDRG